MDQAKMQVLEVAMELAFPQSTLNGVGEKFGDEMARYCAMSTSVGGIGPLLRERIVAQAAQNINVVCVSLLYDSVWVQARHDWGQINLQKKKVGDILRKTLEPTDLTFDLILFDGHRTQVKVWKQMIGNASAYYLDAPDVTAEVYPGSIDAPSNAENPEAWAHIQRIKQNWLVGRGALALCKKIDWQPHITVLSETPTFFAHHRLVTDEYQKDPFFSQCKYLFNDHTPMEYAHPKWDEATMRLTQVDIPLAEKTSAWNSETKELDVTSYLTHSTDLTFGVSQKHRDVMLAMDSLKPFHSKITAVTNGVGLSDWQSPEFNDYKKMTDGQLIESKQKIKGEFLKWALRRFNKRPEWVNSSLERLVVLWTRRVTPYKRLDILVKMLRERENLDRFLKANVMLFVGGRIHQQDQRGQDIIYSLIDVVSNNKELADRIFFIDNFNVWEAPLLYQACDATVMLSDINKEASATGFMKAQLNGGYILATDDGAIPEFVRFHGQNQNGFPIPYENNEPTAEGFLSALEQCADVYRNEQKRVVMMKAALAVSPQVDIQRTAQETIKIYEDILKEQCHPV